jgi:transcriptional regulator with XRE-family HTH domain
MKRKNNIEGYERLKIGSNIRKWRGMKDMKQKELSSALRISEAAFSNIENDMTDMTLSQLEDIALTLDISVEQLFSDPQDKIQHSVNKSPESEANTSSLVMDKELIYALIERIQQKDEQMKNLMNNMITTIDKIAIAESVKQQ